MRTVVFLFVLICLDTSIVLGQNLNMDTKGSAISFTIKNLGLDVKGSFSDFQMKGNFNENDLSESHFSGSAKIKSIDTGINMRNNSLQEKDYFDSESYPEMTLVSNEITKIADGKYEFKGSLKIKGKVKSIQFPISIEKTNTGLIAKGKFEINRLDFGVGKSSWVLKKTVKVSIVYTGKFD